MRGTRSARVCTPRRSGLSPPDDQRRHVVFGVLAVAEVFHVAVIAGDDHQPFGVVPFGERARHHARRTVRATRTPSATVPRCPITSVIQCEKKAKS